MQLKAILTALVGAAMVVDAAEMRRSPFRAALERRQNRNGNQRQGGQNGNNGVQNGNNGGGNGGNNNGNNRGNNGNNGNNGGGNLQLDPQVLQRGSFSDGDNPGSDEQAASAVSNNNFINFCQGKTLTNGAQVRQGSCNGIVMGNIPAVEKMVSSVFVQPQNGDNLPPKQEFDIQVQMANFAPGTFTNATSNYYSAPQDTNGQGFIIGHTHGKTLTNGAQVRQGSCNGIVMGNIPAVEKMVSSVFVQPQNGDNLPPKQEFDIQVQMANFAPGTFTNATSNYYSAPQDTNGQGFIIGHTHVTVQDTGRGLNPQQPLNPQEFVFFKGINDAGNGQGLLSAKVAGGLPPGNYRLCSMASAANHQPVLMPIAQRGAQDDCVRFTVGGGGNGGGGNNNNGQNRNGQNGNVQQGGGRGGLQNNGQVNDGLNGLFPGADSLFPGADGVFQGGKGGRRGQAGQRGLGGASQSAAVGGVAAAEVVQTNDPDRPFSTLGNSFTTQGDAVQRSCDAQRAACQEAVQSGTAEGADASACDAQLAQCISDLS
ncbi:hypothetical protein BBAD15_g7368 [Beauveria bassiana D1-5]|uniref:Ribosomal protein s17 n=1 Tax=Beauveria bassiana D1-5 TaxID=1245745 RepID=A0A0A2W2W7_BEABA|nr:hypothetical protein BBAD15_g7368 [Beauveria bassiana D1-5]